MNHGSLFSGGGGFDLAAELMGWNNVFHCEIDPFCNRILKHYWPNAQSITDIRHFDATPFKGKIDILTGGFPCQPFSNAGKRRGTADHRHLWPDMLRVIREIKPKWVVGENVYGLLNWNEGLVFEQVHSDLEAEGYGVQAFILPASSVNAPHRRYRIWFVAHATSRARCSKSCATHRKQKTQGGKKWQDVLPQSGRPSEAQDVANPENNEQQSNNRKNEKYANSGWTYAQRNAKQVGCFGINSNSTGLERSKETRNPEKVWEKQVKQFTRLCKRGYWREWPTQSPLCGGNDGLPRELDGITFSKWRKETIKMYGNAIVPQVAYLLFQAVKQTEEIQCCNGQL